MIKRFRMLTAFVSLFSLTAMQAQISTCSLATVSASGTDNSGVTATLDDFACVDTLSDSYITKITVTASIGATCPNWYHYALQINGAEVDAQLCNGTFDLSDYGVDLNSVTSIAVISSDNDNYGDGITMNISGEISYYQTDCLPPTALMSSNVGTTTADLDWNTISASSIWDVTILDITDGDTLSDTPSHPGQADSSMTVTGLSPDHTYEAYVRTFCLGTTDPVSPWVGPVTFTMLPTCNPITDLDVSGVTDVAAMVTWTSDEQQWDLELVDVTAGGSFTGNPTNPTLGTESLSLTSLMPDNQYAVKVRSYCGPIDGPSVWSDAFNFTTDPSCIAPSNVMISNVTSDGFTASWMSNDDETTWNLELINTDNGESADLSIDFTSTDTFYAFTGLDPSTDYEVFVSAECSAADQSEWTNGTGAQTLCEPFTMPYTDDLTTWVADCYELSNSGTGSNWQSYGANGIIEAPFWNFSSGTVSFTTGEIMVDAAGGLFEFDWARDQLSSSSYVTANLTVSYTVDGGSTWTSIWSKTGADLHSSDDGSQTVPGTFITAQMALPAESYGNVIQFKFDATTDYGPDLFIDEIRAIPVPPCNDAVNIALDAVTANSATISFVDLADESQSWDYMLINTSTDDTTTGNITTQPTTFSGLDVATVYTIQFSTLCDNDTLDFTNTFSFQTACGAIGESFEGFEPYTNTMPICWNNIVEATNTFASVQTINSSFNAYEDNKSLRFYNSNDASANLNLIAITPELDSISDFWMTFYAKVTTTLTGNSLQVGYITDEADGSTFEMLQEYDMTNAYVKHTFTPSDYPAFTGSKIAMRAEFNGTYRYLHIDNWVWEPIPNCFPPTDLVIDSTSLDAVWATLTPFDTADAEWFVEVVNTTAGDIPTGIATDTVTSTSFMIDGLDHSSIYDIYVLTNCVEILSSWSEGDYSFQTTCAPIAETFEGFEPYTNEMPICWDNIVEATNTFASVQVINSSFNAYEGTKSLRFYNSNDAAAGLIAITPELDSIPDYYMTFYSRTSFGNQSIQVGYVTDESDASSFVMLEEFALTNAYQQFAFVPSQQPAFQGARVAFRAINEGTFDYVYIDNWEWVPFPDCATPINVSGDNILDVSASINWTNLSTTSAWGLELVNITDGGTFTGTATDNATAHPYTFTGLSPNTTYAVSVKADCDTTWTEPFVFTTLIAYDIAVTDFVAPSAQGCMLTGAEMATVTINNYGGQDATGFDVYYSFDGSNYTLDGTYSGTILGNESADYTLNTTFDFQTAFDTTLFVAVSLTGDTVNTANDTNVVAVTNLGNQLGQFVVNTGQYATEPFWAISDSVSGLVVLEHTASQPFDGEYSNYSTYTYDVCFYTGGTYHIEAWDSYGDGWNGGTYSLSQCGGIVIANNGGNEVTTPPSNFNANQLEAEEFFTVEECDDYDLGVIEMSGIDEACGMSASEQGYLYVQNFGVMDITPAQNVSINYQLNGTGWNTLTTITNMASASDSLIALPVVDMTTPGVFTFEFEIIYGDDENADNDMLTVELQSIGQYTDSDEDFESGPGGWTGVLETGANISWEWGTPTTPLISATADGDAWVTVLDANMNLNEESYLLSPCFDFSGYTEDVEVNFDFIWTTGGFGNSMRFQYSTDGGASWPSNFAGVLMPQGTTEWTAYSELIPDLTGESDVKFRFRMDNGFSTDAEGFGLDNFQVLEHVPYQDASLMDLTTNGVTVPGFDPAVFDYSVEVPFGTTAVPVVGATVNAPYYESLTIMQAPTLADTATVDIVAEDTNFTATYTVSFYEGPAEQIATLDDLTVDGVTVPGFLSNDYEYTIVLPYGSAIPTVGYALTSNLSSAVVDPAVAPLTDTTFVVVTAQDVNVQNTYAVIFMEEDPATVSTLDMIFIDQDQVPGFTTLVYDYTVYVDPNLTSVNVFGQLTDGNGSVSYSVPQPMTVPGSVILTVVAEDGVTTTIYTINVEYFQSSDASLTDISLDGTTIDGFSSTTYEYDVVLPYNDPMPDMTWLHSDTNSTVVHNAAASVPGASTLTVTAEDGTTQLIYTINWTYEAPDDNNLLATLSVDFGVLQQTGSNPVLGFDPLVNDYQVRMCDPAMENLLPTLSYTLQSINASDATIDWSSYGETTYITVTAQDGSQNTYSIELINCIGLEEIDAGLINVYPNPTSGLVNLTVDGAIASYNVEVYNAIGQVVYSKDFSEVSETSLDLSNLADGIYQVKVQDTESGKAYQTKLSIAK